jgi:hypothetical protein
MNMLSAVPIMRLNQQPSWMEVECPKGCEKQQIEEYEYQCACPVVPAGPDAPPRKN